MHLQIFSDNSQEGSTIKAALRPMQPLPNDAAPPIPPKVRPKNMLLLLKFRKNVFFILLHINIIL